MVISPPLYDVIIIGGGAAGIMAAIEAGKRHKRTLLIEHTHKIGEKIRISGGGRCNFTNLGASSKNYISQNPHFIKSALARFSQHDFIKLVEDHGIAYHEKTLGQLFCDGSSTQIISMLLNLCEQYGVEIKLNCKITSLSKDGTFKLESNQGRLESTALIIACGGLSIPKIGASDYGYQVARQFGLSIVPSRPALVPLTVASHQRDLFSHLSGVSNKSVVRYHQAHFSENILFTHRGLSGPAILQISSYMETFEGEKILIDLLPDLDLRTQFMKDKNTKQTPTNYLKAHLTNRLVDHLATHADFHRSMTDLKKDDLMTIAEKIHCFQVNIDGSEGYQKAEVTVGGIDTDELSSKTMESKKIPNLYFIGEVVDVTGWLGGYNFQWAWSSGVAAGQSV